MKIKRPAKYARQFRRGFSRSPRHLGIDYGWIIGQENETRKILATATGKVTSVVDGGGNNQNWGNRIIIKHTDRVKSAYAHCATNTFKFGVGDTVGQGNHIATQGETGDTNGIHLHFELYVDGVRVDPQPYLNGAKLPGNPVIPRRTVKKTFTRRVNARTGTTLKSKITRKLKSGSDYAFTHYKHGEMVTQNGAKSDVWVKTLNNDWVWAGNLTPFSTNGLKKVQ